MFLLRESFEATRLKKKQKNKETKQLTKQGYHHLHLKNKQDKPFVNGCMQTRR